MPTEESKLHAEFPELSVKLYDQSPWITLEQVEAASDAYPKKYNEKFLNLSICIYFIIFSFPLRRDVGQTSMKH